MPPANPTILTTKGEELVAHNLTANPPEVATSAPIPGNEQMIYRIDVLQGLATEVLDTIVGHSLKRAMDNEKVLDFVPQPGALAPAHFRRRKARLDNWPISGIIGKTGPLNWKNMVNGGVVAGRTHIELSQNNGRWVPESYTIGYDRKGREDILLVEVVFVDLSGESDLEWENGAPRKQTRQNVTVVVQNAGDGTSARIEPEPDAPKRNTGRFAKKHADA